MLGSISSGTLRSQDLLPRFAEALREVNFAAYAQLISGNWIPAHALEDDDAEFWESEECLWILEDVRERLEEAAPEGAYFGAHPADGADFGFWESDDDDDDDDARSLPSDPSWTDLEAFAAEIAHGCAWHWEDEGAERFAFHGAVYWLASEYHSGQASDLYAALSRCEYRPGPLETAASFAEADFEGGELLEAMREALQNGGQA